MSDQKITLAKGLNMGLRKAMEDDPKVLLMGEDVGKLGGVFRITDGLQKDFGEDRVIDSPLAESGIVGTAVGLALRGYRPVVEIQFDGFVYPAYDQIVCQVAKMTFRSQGKSKMPMVIRIPFGGGIGAVEHHSESPEAQFAHTPGLKVVACSNPVDGYWMIQQAIACDDPVIFLEPKRQYHADKAELDDTATPDAAVHLARRTPRHRRHRARLRPDREDRAEGRRGGRRRGQVARGHRPAHALAARHGSGLRVGAPHRPRRSSPTRRTSTSAWAPSSPRGSPSSASTRSRPRCCGSARSTRPTRRRGSRRTTSPTWTGSWTPSTVPWSSDGADMPEYKLPDVGEGLTEAEIVGLEGQGRRRRRDQRHRRRDRDREVDRRAALAVRRRRSPRCWSPRARWSPVGTPIIAIGETRAEASSREMDLSNPAASGGGEGESLVGRNKADRGPVRRARKVSSGAVAAHMQAQAAFEAGAAPMVEADEEPVPSTAAAPAPPAAVRALAKPPVRKLAKDLGVDLTTLTPTGPNGTVTREDVEAARPAAVDARGCARRASTPSPTGERETREPIKGVRKMMGQAMVPARRSPSRTSPSGSPSTSTRTMEFVERLKGAPRVPRREGSARCWCSPAR